MYPGIPDDCDLYGAAGTIPVKELLVGYRRIPGMDFYGTPVQGMVRAVSSFGQGVAYMIRGHTDSGRTFHLTVLPTTCFRTPEGCVPVESLKQGYVLLPRAVHVQTVQRLFVGARFVRLVGAADWFCVIEGLWVNLERSKNERLNSQSPSSPGSRSPQG